MSTFFHPCSVPSCRALIRPALLMCSPHWRRVPTALKGEVYRAYDLWCSGSLGIEQLREVQQRATDAVVAELTEGGAR